jgi:hypothetical protein
MARAGRGVAFPPLGTDSLREFLLANETGIYEFKKTSSLKSSEASGARALAYPCILSYVYPGEVETLHSLSLSSWAAKPHRIPCGKKLFMLALKMGEVF